MENTLTLEQAITNLSFLQNHKDLRFLNKAEFIALEQSLELVKNTCKEVEILRGKVKELELLNNK
jgi:hypothetical protein